MKKPLYQAYLIHPTTFALDGGAMFGIIPKPIWEKKIKPDNLNRIDMSLRLVLIRSSNRIILIDTGVGEYHGEKFEDQFKIDYQKSLDQILHDELSISIEDVTDVVLTHLHFDHVGGLYNGETKSSYFPNAKLHLHKKHYEYSKSPTVRDAGSFQQNFISIALKLHKDNNQINWLDDSDDTILKDGDFILRYQTSQGHTPFMIHPFTDEFIYMADLVPMEHHIHLPWVMGYDIEPGTTTVFKEKIYEFIRSKNLKMIFEHDIETWGAKLAINEKGRFISQNKEIAITNKLLSRSIRSKLDSFLITCINISLNFIVI